MSSFLNINYNLIEYENDFYIFKENWIYGEYSKPYINEVLKCIDFCKPEMYFHSLFTILNKSEISFSDELTNPSRKHFNNYDKFCKSLFFAKFGIKIGAFDDRDVSELINLNITLVKHFDAYYESIELYVNEKSNISVLGFSKMDNIFGDDKTVDFFLNVMLISYFITTIRFNENIFSDEIFLSDKIWYPDGYRLNIYFTPFALLNRYYIKNTFIKNPKNCLKKFFNSINAEWDLEYNKNSNENIDIEIMYEGIKYVIKSPNQTPYYYLNNYLQDILMLNYLNFLSQNKILTFKAEF